LAVRAAWDGAEGQELREASRQLGVSLVGTPLEEVTSAEFQHVFAEMPKELPEARKQ
jgi:hypothetical protein